MSAEQHLYSQAIIAARRNALSPQHGLEGGRSFRRVLALLGVSATAAAAWYGAFQLYHWLSQERQHPLLASSSEAFSVNVNIENANVVDPAGPSVVPQGVEAESNPIPNQVEAIDYDLRRKTIKVTLHQCPRGYYTPSVAPFPFKLETFLRVANIPYEIDFSYQPANRTSPWMTVNGEDVIESHECVPLLCSTFGVDLEKSARQQSRLTASRLVGIMLDNHIYWGIALWRWVYDQGKSLKVIQPLSPVGQDVVTEVSASVIRASWYHGLGRLSKDQVVELVLVDLADLSAALGNHDYFLGQQPGEVDCNAFAMLAQMVWNMPDCPFEFALKKYSNLVNFVLRMRERFWPDWDSLLQKPGDVELPDSLLYPTGEFQVSRAQIAVDEKKAEKAVAGGSAANANSIQASKSTPQTNKSSIPVAKSSNQHRVSNNSQTQQAATSGQATKQPAAQTANVAQAAPQNPQAPAAQNFPVPQQPGSSFGPQSFANQPQIGQQSSSNQTPPQQFVQQSPAHQIPVQLPVLDHIVQGYGQAPAASYSQGSGYPVLTLNNTVVNQDEKLLRQKQEQELLIQQHLQGLNNLDHSMKMAQLRGYINDTNALQGQQQQFVPIQALAAGSAEQQQYYPTDQNQVVYQNQQQQYDPIQQQLAYASANANGPFDQIQQSQQNYLANNPFIPAEQFGQAQQGFILNGTNRLMRAQQSKQ